MGLEQDTSSPASKRDGAQTGEERKEESYYAPLERTLKDEAPHIMRFLSSTEYVCQPLARASLIAQSVQGLFDMYVDLDLGRVADHASYFKHLHRPSKAH